MYKHYYAQTITCNISLPQFHAVLSAILTLTRPESPLLEPEHLSNAKEARDHMTGP